jgi:hypothetical protein
MSIRLPYSLARLTVAPVDGLPSGVTHLRGRPNLADLARQLTSTVERLVSTSPLPMLDVRCEVEATLQSAQHPESPTVDLRVVLSGPAEAAADAEALLEAKRAQLEGLASPSRLEHRFIER